MFSDFFQGEVGLYSQVLKCINFQGVGTKLTFSEAPAAPKAGLQGVNLLEFGGRVVEDPSQVVEPQDLGSCVFLAQT